MVPMIFWGSLSEPGAVEHCRRNALKVPTTALIPMGAWCELAHANSHPTIKEVTDANEISEPRLQWYDITAKKKLSDFFHRRGVFSLDGPFNGRHY
jgi:hypothetical protein